jgi:hypothetical protein
MTGLTRDRDQDGIELSPADEQLLRELTERARADGLRLTGDGGTVRADGRSHITPQVQWLNAATAFAPGLHGGLVETCRPRF